MPIGSARTWKIDDGRSTRVGQRGVRPRPSASRPSSATKRRSTGSSSRRPSADDRVIRASAAAFVAGPAVHARPAVGSRRVGRHRARERDAPRPRRPPRSGRPPAARRGRRRPRAARRRRRPDRPVVPVLGHDRRASRGPTSPTSTATSTRRRARCSPTFEADPFAPDVWDAFARLCAETDFDPTEVVARVPDDGTLEVLAALRALGARGRRPHRRADLGPQSGRPARARARAVVRVEAREPARDGVVGAHARRRHGPAVPAARARRGRTRGRGRAVLGPRRSPTRRSATAAPGSCSSAAVRAAARRRARADVLQEVWTLAPMLADTVVAGARRRRAGRSRSRRRCTRAARPTRRTRCSCTACRSRRGRASRPRRSCAAAGRGARRPRGRGRSARRGGRRRHPRSRRGRLRRLVVATRTRRARSRRTTRGGSGEVIARCVKRMPVTSRSRVRAPRRAGAAVPAVAAGDRARVAVARLGAARPEPPAVVGRGTSRLPARCAGVQVIGRSSVRSTAGDERAPSCTPPLRIMFANAQKSSIVETSQPDAFGIAGGVLHQLSAAASSTFEHAGLGIGRVLRREPVAFRGRHAERRVAHAQRREQPRAQEVLERLARRRARAARRAPACRCCTSTARPAGASAAAWRRRAIHSSGVCGEGGHGGPSVRSSSAASAVWIGYVSGRRHDRAESEAEREQVLDRDRALAPARCRRARRRCSSAPAIGELGQQVVDRVVEPQRAVVDEHHRGDGRDRLRQRRDAEDRRRAPWARGRRTPSCRSPRPRRRRRARPSAIRPGMSPRST